jgi:hypothetical protein
MGKTSQISGMLSCVRSSQHAESREPLARKMRKDIGDVDVTLSGDPVNFRGVATSQRY